LHLSDSPAVASLPARDRILIRCCVLAVAALAWAYLLYLDRQMSHAMQDGAMPGGMDMLDMAVRPWTAADILFSFVMWTVMMVGMMAGSALPVLLLFAGAQARRQGQGTTTAVLAFGLGYAIAWTGFSAFATLAQWALHDAALLSPAMAASSAKLGGAILCVAGLYQLTPLKQVCLQHCRSPLGFLMTHWRDGSLGALQMGMRHGIYCLGCCWALMGLLFVVGVMNLIWVAALALFVLLEKVGPAGVVVARAAGIVMIASGVFLLAGAR
jgi:predicted metal-binding membrane protein